MMLARLSAKEAHILDLLRSGRERFGLEMVKLRPRDLKRGTIYVTLGRMVEKGYVQSRLESEPDHAGMPRRLYMITGEGQRALHVFEASISAADSFEAGRGYCNV